MKPQIEQFKPSDLQFAMDAPAESNITSLRDVDVKSEDYARLVKSLREHGQIMPLVYQRAGTDRYVIIGNHRLCGLREIGAESVMAVDVEALGGEPLEIALADQIIRSPLHPVDKFEAFDLLVSDGATPEKIASRFSISVAQVRQALALAALAPEIRTAWRSGKINEETARAFTLSSDHKRQVAVFEEMHESGEVMGAYGVRTRIVGEHGEGGDALALIGIDHYRARGGQVTEDLFGVGDIVSDPALLKQMADEAVEAECKRLVADGWASAVPTELANDYYCWRYVPSAGEGKATKEETARTKAIDKRIKALIDLDERTNEQQDEQERLGGERTAIHDAVRMRAYTEEEKAGLTCIVSIGPGGLRINYGHKRPAEAAGKKAKADAGATPAQREKAKADAAEKGEVSNALEKDLAVWLKAATKNVFSTVAAVTKADHFVSCITGVIADLIDPDSYTNPISDKQMAALRESVPADLMLKSCSNSFDADSYFKRIPKTNIVAIVREAINAAEASRVEKMKSGDAQAYAITNVPPTGWLPPQMRTQAYALLTPGAIAKQSKRKSKKGK